MHILSLIDAIGKKKVFYELLNYGIFISMGKSVSKKEILELYARNICRNHAQKA